MFSITALRTLVVPFTGSLIQKRSSRSTELSPNSTSRQFGAGSLSTRGTSRAASSASRIASCGSD